MSLVKEFKAFVMKSSMVDLAIGIVIGVAFGKVVTSFVSDILMPPIGLLIGGIDFTSFQVVLKQATTTQPAVTLKYGAFISALIDFLIISCVIFFVIKGMNKLRGTKPEEIKTQECPECLSSIPLKAKKCKYCTSQLISTN